MESEGRADDNLITSVMYMQRLILFLCCY